MIKEIIRAEGPISVERYFQLCVAQYYATREPFGASGDFVTAPEYSQLFGEMIGVWCVAVCQTMGNPANLQLIELGPGRGTLMADVLRASRLKVPVHFVESSPRLRAVQKDALARTGATASWHTTLEEVPLGPSILVANEFFDALPVQQYQWRDGGWHERMVGLGEDGELVMGLSARMSRLQIWAGHKDLATGAPALPTADGDILELSPARAVIAREIARRQCHALIIDYGHRQSGFGDTLQAMRNHAFHPMLENPGDADLTSHVDFAQLATVIMQNGAVAHGPMTQGAFLTAMGIEVRVNALRTRANAAQAKQLSDALERLAGDDKMGRLFKVLAVSPVNSPQPYPFGAP